MREKRAFANSSPASCLQQWGTFDSAATSGLENWRQQFDVMVLNQIRCVRAVLASMLEKKWGRIPNLVISNSLRSALVAFSKTLSIEVAGSGVTVNTIVPGRIATPRVAQLDQAAADREKSNAASMKQKSVQAIPAGRYGDPAEFANVATFLVRTRQLREWDKLPRWTALHSLNLNYWNDDGISMWTKTAPR